MDTIDYTTRQGTAMNPNAIQVRFHNGEFAVVHKTHRQNGFGPKPRSGRVYGWSTHITRGGRVVDNLFCRSWDELIEKIRRGEHRLPA